MTKRRLTGIPKRRLATHGDFAQSAEISQRIKYALRLGPKWHTLTSAQREAVEMNAFKLARIVCGDPDHVDHWDDTAGYAQLGRAACKRRGR